MLPFDAILVDVLNVAYRVLEDRYKKSRFQQKSVYTDLFSNFVNTIREIESKYLSTTGNVYLLFDNSDSKQDLQDSFYNVRRKNIYPEYKVHRKKDNKDFYQTIDLLKYYYMVNTEKYVCIQISNLEADDLVRPVLSHYIKPAERALFITNDSDWARYISDRNFILDNFVEDPSSIEDYSKKLGFPITESNIVLYKSFFGDAADEILQIIPKTEKNLEMFYDIIKRKNENLNELVLEARKGDHPIFKLPEFKTQTRNSDGKIEKDSLYKLDQFIINLRLVSSINIDKTHLLAATVMGRNSIKLKEAVEKAMGLLSSQKKFTFGYKRPRV